MPDIAKSKLNALVERHPVSILTGRSLPNLKYAVGEGLSPEIILIGTHGAEPLEEIHESPYEQEWRLWSELFSQEADLVYEPKALTFAIHFKAHSNPTDMIAKFYSAYRGEYTQLPSQDFFTTKFRVQEGIGVFELIPQHINKGMGIDYLHAKFPEHQLIFFGDDLTDNYAHARVNELGGRSYQVGYRLSGENRVAQEIIPSIADVYAYIEKQIA